MADLKRNPLGLDMALNAPTIEEVLNEQLLLEKHSEEEKEALFQYIDRIIECDSEIDSQLWQECQESQDVISLIFQNRKGMEHK